MSAHAFKNLWNMNILMPLKTGLSRLSFNQSYGQRITFLFFIWIVAGFSAAKAQTVQEYEERLKIASDDQRPGILNQLSVLSLKNSTDKSISYAEQALKASKQSGDVNEEVSAQMNLASGYETQKNYRKAIYCLQATITIFVTNNHSRNAGVAWSRIGDDYRADNDFQKAIDAYRQAIACFIQAKDKKGVLNAKVDIGDIYLQQKEYQRALELYIPVRKEYEETGDVSMVIKTLSRIGSAYSNWGNFDEAIKYLNDAVDLAKKNKMATEATTLKKSLDIVVNNKSNFSHSQTTYAIEKQEEMIGEVDKQQDQIHTLSVQKAKSLEEIAKLSTENQLKEFRIKAQEDELIKQKLEAINRSKEIQLLKLDKEIKEISIQKQRQFILWVVTILILVAVFSIFIFRSLIATKKQKVVIHEQKLLVDKKNKHITDSIKSALTIQESILPKTQVFGSFFRDSFILFLPKDIVSGDIYWIKNLNDELLFSVIDCTGHGVPGAFMSLHAYNQLEYIVNEKRIESPAHILSEMNKSIVQTMREEDDELFVKNGMDMGMVKLNKKDMKIEFSGAKHSLIVVRDGAIIELKGDSSSIGNMLGTMYSAQTIDVFFGDMLYLFSDGYKDQKGGTNNKSLYSKPFKKILAQIAEFSCMEQNRILNQKYIEWKKDNTQNDDICVMGIRI